MRPISIISTTHSTSPTYATSPPLLSSLSSPPRTAGFPAEAFSTSGGARSRTSSTLLPQVGKALAPFPVNDSPVKILLLENVNTAAVALLKAQGYVVDELKKALGEDELIATLQQGGFQAVGIRSKTKITARVIKECPLVSLIKLCRVGGGPAS